MAGYTELIKNFEKIRAFTRDFFIYGFKGRNDFPSLSARSYDNERRRIESYLSDLVVKNHDKRGKTLSISSNTIAKTANPLFKIWQTKSFTKKDCFLHFVLLDILSLQNTLGVTKIAEIISHEYTTEFMDDMPIDAMTIRNKLNEYTHLGILEAKKCGKTLCYSLARHLLENINLDTKQRLDTALSYYKNVMSGGFIAHSITNLSDSPFIYRQIFFAQILDDELLLRLLRAIAEKRFITLTMTTKNEKEADARLLPLKVLSNTKTGRRYLAVCSARKKKYSTIRLDYIQDVIFGDVAKNYDIIKEEYEVLLRSSFSIMHQAQEDLFHVRMVLHIDENTEQYVLERIKREGKHGVVTKIDEHTFEYSIHVADTLEMVPWLRTFIGRIVQIEGSETRVISQFKKDMETLASMYSNME